MKKLTKTIIATTSILTGAVLSTASSSQAVGTQESSLLSYSPHEFTKVGVNGSGTAYEMTGLMDIAAEAQVQIDAGATAHVKRFKTWLAVRTEGSSWVQFSDDGYSKSFPFLQRPQTVDVVVPIAVPHMTLTPLMVTYCNALADGLRAQGKSNEEIFSQDRTVPIAIDSVASAKLIPDYDVFGQGGPIEFSDWPQINLICKGRAPTPPVHTAGYFKPPPVKFEINDIDLFLSTYSNADTQPGKFVATSCKKGQIKVRVATSKPGLAHFKLWKKIGAGAATSSDIEAEAVPDGNGGFAAEHVEWVSVDKMTNLRAKAEEIGTSFAKVTPWKNITLQCAGSGSDFSQDTSDYQAKGFIWLLDKEEGSKENKCSRSANIRVKFQSNYSTPIDYRVTCNTGLDESGTLDQLGTGGLETTWIGETLIPFQVNKAVEMGCVLRHIRNGKATIVATDTREFSCKPTTVDTRSDDLVHDTNPVEPVIPTAKHTGELTLADSATVKRNSCPRDGQAVFKINSSNSADVPYTFVCTNGQSWQGNMTMFPNGPGKYQGVAAKTFPVTKTENVACVLKRVKGDKAYLLTAAAKQYNCVKSTGVSVSDDLAPSPQPGTDPDLPQAQSVKGDFSFVDHGSPKCTRTGKALVTLQSPKADNIHLSLDCKEKSHSAVVPVAPNPAGGYSAVKLISFDIDKTIDESCTLRTVAPYGPKDHVTKQHPFQCVTPSGHSASNDVQVPSNPPSGKPDAPATLVPTVPHKVIVGTGASGYPFPPWQCQGGYPRQSGCTCPPHKKLIYTQVEYHGHVYNGSKCVLSGPSDKTTAPGSSTPDFPQLTVACKDEEQRVGGKCVKIPGVSIHCKPDYHQEGTKCVRNPVNGVGTVDSSKSDAIKRRLEAAKKAADAKRKREEAAARALKLKAAQAAAIAKRKRDAAAKAAAVAVAKRKAAVAVAKRKAAAALAQRKAAAALVQRNAAAALARRKAALKKRAAPSSIGNATQMRIRRR